MSSYVTKPKRRSRRGKGTTLRGKSAMATAKKALREVKKLSAASGPHLKDIDNDDAFGVLGTPTVQDTSAVTFIAAGDDETDRTGDFINVRSVQIDGSISQANSQSMVHIAVVIDKQQVADTNVSYSDVYETASVGDQQGLYKVRRQEDSLGRYRVLYSKMFRVDTAQYSTSYFNKYISFKNPLKVEYNGTGSGDIQKNGIYVVARCDSDATPSATTVPLLSWTTRIRFDP